MADLFGVNSRAAKIRKNVLDRMHRRATNTKLSLTPTVREYLKDAKRKGYIVTILDDEDDKED